MRERHVSFPRRRSLGVSRCVLREREPVLTATAKDVTLRADDRRIVERARLENDDTRIELDFAEN